jgi:hypothetical protein
MSVFPYSGIVFNYLDEFIALNREESRFNFRKASSRMCPGLKPMALTYFESSGVFRE